MDIESPRIKIRSTIADIPSFAFIIDWINTIAPACYNQCMEISYCDFINFLLAKLFKLPDVLSFSILI
jgi:hypothetical protein